MPKPLTDEQWVTKFFERHKTRTAMRLDEAFAEIARLQEAKRKALAVADERVRENVGLRLALATVRGFIEGEMIAHAVVVPEGAQAPFDECPSLLQVIDAALGVSSDEQ